MKKGKQNQSIDMKYKCMVMNKVRKRRIKNDKFILARNETIEMMRRGLESTIP
jgi:hypothetical protein